MIQLHESTSLSPLNAIPIVQVRMLLQMTGAKVCLVQYFVAKVANQMSGRSLQERYVCCGTIPFMLNNWYSEAYGSEYTWSTFPLIHIANCIITNSFDAVFPNFSSYFNFF